jgi:hypothetical protein
LILIYLYTYNVLAYQYIYKEAAVVENVKVLAIAFCCLIII